MRLCCPKCCEGYSDELDHCPKCGPTWSRPDIGVMVAERDLLAAENAELKDLLAIEQIPHADANEQLAAANATLDRLREAVPEGLANNWCCKCKAYVDLEHIKNYGDIWIKCKECGSWDHEQSTEAADHFRTILYPPETTSIRDIAAAHGFDAMPDDLAQRSVDGETNYVRLNPENDHANHD